MFAKKFFFEVLILFVGQLADVGGVRTLYAKIEEIAIKLEVE